MTIDPVQTKLSAARTKLILDKPFLGALVLRLPLTEAADDWCKTTATDARAFYYNRGYIDQLTLDETQFVLAHEALHCALSHFARRMHRAKHRWDLACDLAVNPLLADDGLKAPPGSLIIEDYKGMTAEEIYPLLEEDEDKETLDQHVYDSDSSNQGGGEGGEGDSPMPSDGAKPDQGGPPSESQGQGRPPPLEPDERETLSVQWQQRMAGAAQQAMLTGKLGGELARMIDQMRQPQLPWRSLLARFLSNTARDDYSYMRPSRREGDFILPSLRSQHIDLVVALDTSGSIQQDELAEFAGEIDALKGQIRARVTLTACDAKLAEDGPWVYEPWEEFKLPRAFKGGGGTDFSPVFDWVERSGLQPQALVYFTDAEGYFPDRPPAYPVIWLVKGKLPAPWGERIQLN